MANLTLEFENNALNTTKGTFARMEREATGGKEIMYRLKIYIIQKIKNIIKINYPIK